MKLLSCYIKNFGNIRQRDYNFSEGITAFCEQNGYGKTTLASFLKAMFYGMKTTTARDKEVGERERFYPFDGGKYGGNVTFEFDGDIYRIERFFGKKSASDDTVAVFRSGVRLPENVDAGKEFFGLDEQSFLKTVFINSDDTEVSATGDISKMLNEFVDDADFEGAMAALRKKEKEYKALKGNNDKISHQKFKINELNNTIENKQKISDGLSLKYEKLNALKEEVDRLHAKQNAFVESNLEKQKWDTYDNYRRDADEAHKNLSAVRGRYPAGLPTAEEVQTLLDCAGKLSLAKERLAASQLPPEKEARLEELKISFKDGFPTDGQLASINEMTARKIRLDAEISALEDKANSVRDIRFQSGLPDGAEVEKYGQKLQALRELKEKKENPAPPEMHKKLLLIPAILALVLIGSGIGLWFVKVLIGGILLAVGAITALVGVFFYFKSQINLVKAANGNSSDAEVVGLENDIRSFLSRLGYYSAGGVEVDFNNLLRDIDSFKQGLRERQENASLSEGKKTERQAVDLKIKEFLSAYGFAGENQQAELAELNRLIAEYAALNSEKEGVGARIAACNTEIKTYTGAAIDILSKYDVVPSSDFAGQARQIDADRKEEERLNKSFKELDRRAVSYRAENALSVRPLKDVGDGAEVKELLKEKTEELTRLDRDIDDDESATENLDELKEELASAEEELKELFKKYDIIKKTASLLERAEANLKDRYVRPIKESFLNYSQALEKALGEKVSMDKEFRVYFERSGENRSDAHLSAGQKSLCALCVRLALIDNMYKGERPFIIMDDPFVHLDAEHMQRARALLSLLAKDRQIIYFCCHSSREL